MNRRDVDLQVILECARRHITSSSDERCRAAASRVFEHLERNVGDDGAVTGERIPVCRYLDAAYAGMTDGKDPLPAIAKAFAGLEGRLHWWRRKGAAPENQPFYDGHANAMLIGPGGIEQREDVMVGVSLMAPPHRLSRSQPSAGGSLYRLYWGRLVECGNGLDGAWPRRPCL